MEAPFVSIAEAAAKTGRSESTIRRIIKSIVRSPAHADRAAVLPTPKEVSELKKKGENFGWKIREDVLMAHIERAQKEEKKSEPVHGKEDVLTILSRELELKNKQIEKQWEVIHSLNERLREGNILMGSLQQRLALPHPEAAPSGSSSPSSAPSTEASKEASTEPIVAAFTKASKKNLQKASKKPSRRRLLAWLFK